MFEVVSEVISEVMSEIAKRGNMKVSLILASQSPARRAVLAAAGVIPVIHVSEVDEPAALRNAANARGVSVEHMSAEERVLILARAKAFAVYESWKLVADAAASASGDLVVGYPLEAESEAENAESESSESESSETASSALADDSQSDVTHNVDTAQTRDFSGVKVPTKTFDIHDFAHMNESCNDCNSVLIVGCDSMFLQKHGVAANNKHAVAIVTRFIHMRKIVNIKSLSRHFYARKIASLRGIYVMRYV